MVLTEVMVNLSDLKFYSRIQSCVFFYGDESECFKTCQKHVAVDIRICAILKIAHIPMSTHQHTHSCMHT